MGMSVMHAGQIGSITALGWSFSAMIVARLDDKQATRLIIVGPILLTIGMFLLAWAIDAGNLPVDDDRRSPLCGIGFGISNGFICQRTIATSDDRGARRDLRRDPDLRGAGRRAGRGLCRHHRHQRRLSGLLDASTRPIVWTFLIGGLLGRARRSSRPSGSRARRRPPPLAPPARGVDCPVTSGLGSHAHAASVHAGSRPIGRALLSLAWLPRARVFRGPLP